MEKCSYFFASTCEHWQENWGVSAIDRFWDEIYIMGEKCGGKYRTQEDEVWVNKDFRLTGKMLT